MEKTSERHFVLVHGSCHGAWCWFEVATLLRAAGHRVTAVDLAASGINPKQLNDLHTYSEYIEPLLSFMATLGPNDERVILVGHSSGGFAISVAMERLSHKVAVGVFVTAFLPGPDLTIQAIYEQFNLSSPTIYLDSKLTLDAEHRVTSFLFGPEFLSTRLYQLSPPEDITLAKLLVRPYPMFYDSQSEMDTTLTREKYGSVNRVFIICDQDMAITREQVTWMIQNNPPDEVENISTDHMVMFSKPLELSSKLQAIAKKYY